MRTGPDLINVGARLPDPNWHLVHLYNPRAVVPWSIMPSFPFLFEERAVGGVRPGERVVPVQGPRAPRGKVVVATPDALALVAYLLSLKREYPVPPSQEAPVGGKPAVTSSAVHRMTAVHRMP
jgi:cytochrome c oxidase cbb3-type subunit 2